MTSLKKRTELTRVIIIYIREFIKVYYFKFTTALLLLLLLFLFLSLTSSSLLGLFTTTRVVSNSDLPFTLTD